MMKTLALVLGARVFINCILWIVNNYSKIILLKERDLNVVHRRMAEA